MDELIAFVRQQLDEDERVAREAGDDGLRWRVEGPNRSLVDEYRAIAIAPYEGELHEAEHIARWDPARVLAEVEAKRRVLGLHAHYPAPDGFGCSICAINPNGNYQEPDGWCETVLALAQPYAGRPGWRDEWQVSAPT